MLNKIAIFILRGTRPLLGPPARCRYPISCTDFAIEQLQQKNLFAALWAIGERLLTCNPFC